MMIARGYEFRLGETFYPARAPIKRPDEVKFARFLCASVLGADDIDSVTAKSEPGGLEIDQISIASNKKSFTARLSGGVAETDYESRFKIETGQGSVIEASFRVGVE